MPKFLLTADSETLRLAKFDILPRRAPLELKYVKSLWRSHRSNATKKGIPFKISFVDWLTIWLESGHLHERGPGRGQYCMGRYGDKGAYEVGNVRIITNAENNAEWSLSAETRARLSESMRGENNQFFGRKHTLEALEKNRQAHLGKKPSPETLAKRSKSLKAAWARRKGEVSCE